MATWLPLCVGVREVFSVGENTACVKQGSKIARRHFFSGGNVIASSMSNAIIAFYAKWEVKPKLGLQNADSVALFCPHSRHRDARVTSNCILWPIHWRSTDKLKEFCLQMAKLEWHVRSAIEKGWLCKFRSCGTGQLLSGYLKLQDTCTFCHEELNHHKANGLPVYLTILIVDHIMAPVAAYCLCKVAAWTVGFICNL